LTGKRIVQRNLSQKALAFLNRLRPMTGCVDGCDGLSLWGWACDRDRPDAAVEVEIRVDGRPYGRVRADQFREDLVTRGFGSGRHAFEWVLPAELFDDRPHAFDLVVAETGGRLHASPFTLATPRFRPITGCVDGCDGLSLWGWACDRGRPDVAVEVEIRVDGRPYGRVRADQFRGDLAMRGFGSRRHAFEWALPAELLDDRPHAFDLVVAETGVRLHASPFTLAPARFYGQLRHDNARIEGEIVEKAQPARKVGLRLVLDGNEAAVLHSGEAVREVVRGDIAYVFRQVTAPLPRSVFAGGSHQFHLAAVNGAEPLFDKRFAAVFLDLARHAPMMRAAMPGGCWGLGELGRVGAQVRFTGWKVALGRDAAETKIAVRGGKVVVERYGATQAIACFPAVEPHEHVTFDLTVRPDEGNTREILVDQVVAATGEPLCGYHETAITLTGAAGLPIPPEDLRERVVGFRQADAFIYGGYALYRKIEKLLAARFGLRYADMADILDWGCGCGRLLRHFQANASPGTRRAGCDIDAEAVAWCAANLPGIEVAAIAPDGPTPFADGRFDLVLGGSVFSHLNEDDQFRWLGELRRIAKPGGLVLVSIHGPGMIGFHSVEAAPIERLAAEGFAFFPNPSGLTAIVEAARYGAAFHTHDYVKQRWPAYFDVLEILPFFNNNLQDLVVLRRRAD
jgi:SAM-dependent methyltransferase